MSDAREDKAEVAGSEPPAALTATDENGMSAAAAAAELSGPGVNVRFAGRSSVGLVREHNEDNLVIANLTTGEIATRDAVQVDAVGEGGPGRGRHHCLGGRTGLHRAEPVAERRLRCCVAVVGKPVP